jgi:hypothetical protein
MFRVQVEELNATKVADALRKVRPRKPYAFQSPSAALIALARST